MTVEFVAATERITDLFTLLKPLGSKVCDCTVAQDGLQFAIDIDKISLLQSWVPADIFYEWNFVELEFSIDIGLLLESLHVFAQEKNLKIQCSPGECILSCEGEPSTRISLKTYDSIHVSNLSSVFGDSVLTKVIIKSQGLSDVLGDLDASCNLVTFSVSNTCLFMSSIGSFGEIEIKFKKESSVFDSFEYFGGMNDFSASYNFSLFKHCVKALATSKKTCLRVNHDGILSLQFMIPLSNESKFSFIEFAVFFLN